MSDILAGLAFCAVPGTVFSMKLMIEATRRYLTYRSVRDMPTSTVRAASVGLVELSGTASPAEPLMSPISRRPCIFYRIVAQYPEKTRDGWEFKDFYSSEKTVPFFLDDRSGAILVDPDGARFRIRNCEVFRGHISGKDIWGKPAHKIDGRAIAYVNALEPKARKRFMDVDDMDLRIREFSIPEGRGIYVMGTALPRAGSQSPVAHENLLVQKAGSFFYIRDELENEILGELSGYKNELIAGSALFLSCMAVIFLFLAGFRIGF
ncbi:MAG: hypothetical protein AB1295_03635 [Candidatus Micrarchaeota archaeon]